MMTDPQIRAKAAEILIPKPWKHKTISDGCGESTPCTKCGAVVLVPLSYDETGDGLNDCPIPDLLTDPLPVIAERLLREVPLSDLIMAILQFHGQRPLLIDDRDLIIAYEWFIKATPLKQCEVLIQALETHR